MNRVKLILVSDTHLGFDYPLRPKSNRPRRGQDFFDNFQRVLQYAVKHEICLVVHGGDLFFRSRVPARIIDLVYELLFRYAEKGIQILLVPGNHERGNLPPSLLLLHPNIRVFDRLRWHLLNLGDLTIAFGGFPFIRHKIRDKMPQLISRLESSKPDAHFYFLCMHQTVEGATVGPADYVFRQGPEVIRRNAFSSWFHGILCGHIHRQQILVGKPEHPAVFYPGSIERTSFAEKREKKGFLELELQQPETIRSVNFRPLPARPIIDIPIQDFAGNGNPASALKERLAALPGNSVVRFSTSGPIDPALLKHFGIQNLRRLVSGKKIIQLSTKLIQQMKDTR